MEGTDDPRVLIPQVKELRTFGQNALGELRNLISDLRPPQLDDLGLAAALRWYIQAYEQRRRIAVELRVEGDDALLPAEYGAVLFRIAQEALTNIAKHAEADQVEVALQIKGAGRDNGRALMRAAQPAANEAAGWAAASASAMPAGRILRFTLPGAGAHLNQLLLPGVCHGRATQAGEDERARMSGPARPTQREKVLPWKDRQPV
jgi:hypothetical protein